ncbi:hypothetical protein M434DRAFT_317865 [Hypoxylon sp. CO27-5]|nr:hypothetical protein M434DRAFT_317865 [Hypoxylon sp. CO27-5]
MADNMCGPSNGLKGISRHFDANRSEQRDRITSTHPGHAFSQTEHARQDEEFARFQQGTTLLGGPTPINSTHGYVPPQYITPNPNTHPMLVPMPVPPTIPNTMSNAGAQGLNMANVNQYRESPHAFMNSTNSLTQARPGPPVQVGPSSRPPTTNYPLNHHHTPGIMRGSTQFGYRPMPNPMAGPIPFNSQPSSLYHQQPQDAELASAAQGVLNAVSKEYSEKFKSSRFLDMMRKVAAMDLVVRGNDLVNPEAADSAEGDPASKSTGEARP